MLALIELCVFAVPVMDLSSGLNVTFTLALTVRIRGIHDGQMDYVDHV